VASAIDAALWDIEAQRARRPLAALLGTPRRSGIALYANIDRRTRDRHPAGFRASATVASRRGHRAIKIAPFDGVEPSSLHSARGRWEIDRGLERIAAVRQAIGPEAHLLVDCHGRFDEAGAAEVLRRMEPLGIFWLECPLPEALDNFSAIRRLRSLANDRGIALAGCGVQTGLAGFRPFIEAGLYDIVMPDVTYAGGLAEMRRIADFAASRGVRCSLRNASGPISHAASLHVSAVLDDFDFLEQQFDESSLFRAICPALPIQRNGSTALPRGTGLGVTLDDEACAAVTWTPSSPASDPAPLPFFARRGLAAR
jgi:galactonate dehydratase